MQPTTARIKGYDEPLPVPLTRNSIPKKSALHSPRHGQAHGIDAPLYPGQPGFDEWLNEVVEVRRQVELMQWPRAYLENASGTGGVPELFKLYDKRYPDRALGVTEARPQSAAEIVRMDDPVDLGIVLYKALSAMKADLNRDGPHVEFVEGYVQFLRRLSVRIHAALDKIFDVKYFYMLERPETVLGLPGCLFTGDGYGAPNHPSYGAGHGAAAGATESVILNTFDLREEEQAMVRDACYQFAHYRTLLGVHYRADNDVGLAIGRSVVS